ncbi:putative F-box protein [Cardamine amara subsp. amara]|uniref:F-box protein n=1 Tax=Cardamine amara subsp. amara TaxID=228776 RepID=A0ABD1AL45_CARAN
MADVPTPSDCLADQCGKTKRDSSEDLDLISSLPDVILQHILSLIPTKFAIRTTVLSKRWRHVWSHTPSLYFPRDLYRFRLKADSINKTLTCYKAPKIITFNLCSIYIDHLPYIDGWIEFAMSRNVENLSLKFDFNSGKRYKIPEFFYINSSVKQLRVEAVELSFHDMIPKCSVSWTSLKKLHLRYCKLSDESLAKILSGCPILESLTLYLCDKVRVLDLSKSLRLRVLVIDGDIWVPGPTQIVAPHIHCLRLRNSQLPCTLVDVSSLTEAKLDIFFCSPQKLKADFLQTMFLEMLEKLQNVEKLTFGANFLKVLSLAELRGVHFPSLKVKVLTLETMISQYVIPGIVRLQQNSPELKKLTVHTTTDDGSIPNEYIDKYLDFVGLNSAQLWSSKAMEDIIPKLTHINNVSIVFSSTKPNQNGSLNFLHEF